MSGNEKVLHMQVYDSISTETSPAIEIDRRPEDTIERLAPLFSLRRPGRNECVTCLDSISPQGEFVYVNERYKEYQQHGNCSLDFPGDEFSSSGFNCGFCQDPVRVNEIVKINCSCQSYFHTSCAERIVRTRNERIIQFGFMVGFLKCPSCLAPFFDMMHFMQRYNLMLFRDLGDSSVERAMFSHLYSTMYPESNQIRALYFRIAHITNPKCFSEEWDRDFVLGFRYRKFNDFIIRKDITWGFKAEPVFNTHKDKESFPVNFPDICNIPYPNSHREEQRIDYSDPVFKPKKRLIKSNNSFCDDFGYEVSEEDCLRFKTGTNPTFLSPPLTVEQSAPVKDTTTKTTITVIPDLSEGECISDLESISSADEEEIESWYNNDKLKKIPILEIIESENIEVD